MTKLSSRSPSPAGFARARGRLLVPAVLAGFFFCVSVAGRLRAYRLHELALLLLIYWSLAFCTHSVSLLIRKVPGPTRAASALLIGCAAVYHLRHQTDWIWFLQKPILSFGLLLGVSAAAYLLDARSVKELRIGSLVKAAVAAGVFFLTLLALGSQVSGSMRWNLLKHNRMVGTLLYHARIAPLAGIEESLDDIPIKPLSAAFQRNGEDVIASDESPGNLRRDVVFLVIDTLRADALAPFGGESEPMPELSRLADTAFAFTDVWATASWTRPSIVSFFTGLLPEQAGVLLTEDVLAPDTDTLAERYKRRGFETAAFVTNDHVGSAVGFAQGFDHFEEFQRERIYARAETVADTTVAWLDRRRGAELPLFLYVHLLDPHTPYRSGGERLYDSKHSRSAYRKELEYVDRHAARLIEALRARLGPDTIILLTSDHGEEFGDHGMFGHGHTLYRELLWIPTLFWVGSEETTKVETKLDGRDLFDLLDEVSGGGRLDVADWARRAERSVRYASSYARLGKRWSDRLLFPYRYQRLRGIEWGGSFLIWSGYGSTYELYDQASDHLQLENVADRLPDRVERLREALDPTVGYRVVRQQIGDVGLDRDRLRALGYVQ